MAGENKQEKQYYFYFKGLKLTKREANVAGLSMIFGILGAVVATFLPIHSKLAAISIITVFLLAGYVFGRKIFR